MSNIITIGEIMLRLSPPGFLRFSQTTSYDAVFGGGEANVAVCCAGLGDNARFLTRIPNNPIGDACVAELRKQAVDVSFIARGGERLGIYFCEKGASQRASKVVYDRKHSAISDAKTSDFDIKHALYEQDFLHFTGITPALSPSSKALILDVLKETKAHKIKVSCDLNYRAKLWTKAEAKATMTELTPYIDVLIANEQDMSDVFGIIPENTTIEKGELSKDAYKSVCKQAEAKYGIKTIAITLRESFSASHNGWGALLYAGGEFYESRHFDMTVIDRVGGGDSFAGGLLHALMRNEKPQDAIDFAVCCSALKHTIEGDFNLVTRDEVLSLMKSGGSGRVER